MDDNPANNERNDDWLDSLLESTEVPEDYGDLGFERREAPSKEALSAAVAWPQLLGNLGDYNHFMQAWVLVKTLSPNEGVMVVVQDLEGKVEYERYIAQGGLWKNNQTELQRALAVCAIAWCQHALPKDGGDKLKAAAYTALSKTRDEAVEQDKVLHSIPQVFLKFKMPIRTVDDLNHPGAAAVANGVVELSTGKLLPDLDARKYNITTLASPVKYEPHEFEVGQDGFVVDPPELPERVKMLTSHLSNADAHLLWAWLGQSMHKQPSRGALFLLGPGGTGKSTFLRALDATLGSYMSTMDSKTLMGKTADGQTYVANSCALHRAGIVYDEEVETIRLNADQFKRWTGGGRTGFTCNPKMAQAHHATQTATLVFATNDMPYLPYEDGAVLERLFIVEFPTIPEERRSLEQATVARGDDEQASLEREWILKKLLWYAKQYPRGTALPVHEELARRRQQLAQDRSHPLQDFVNTRVEHAVGHRLFVDEVWKELLEIDSLGEFYEKFPKQARTQLNYEGLTHRALPRKLSKLLNKPLEAAMLVHVMEGDMLVSYSPHKSRYWQDRRLRPPASEEPGQSEIEGIYGSAS